MAGKDRLSALGDDILHRILHFAPTMEAASTSVLSRRWRSLWRSSGAVNLTVNVLDDGSHCYRHDPQRRKEAEDAFLAQRDAFVRAAEAALTGAASPITRLTFHVEGDNDDMVGRFLNLDRDCRERADPDMVGTVVTHPAARRVEELVVAVVQPNDDHGFEMEASQQYRRIYALSSLPSETLRMLDLTKCSDLMPPELATAFPRLAMLRLRLCTVELKNLQALIDAAPELATVHLDSVFFTVPQESRPWIYNHFQQRYMPQRHNAKPDGEEKEAPVLRLRCTAATVLVMVLCGLEIHVDHSQDSRSRNREKWAIEIDAPRLRSFTYKGDARPFQLRSPTPDLAHADLHLLNDYGRDYNGTTRVLFWQLVKNFTNAKSLKLKVNYLKDIAAIGESGEAEFLCPFPNVKRLDLEGSHDLTCKTAAVAIANLLHCCPVLADLKLKLSTVSLSYDVCQRSSTYGYDFLQRKERSDYDKSVNGFMRRKSNPVISLNNCGYKCGKVSDLPGLTGGTFACLQSTLRRVSLQFRLDTSRCFGVRLIRYFSDNANVLEEICVDSGNRKLCEHMNLDVETWVAPDSLKACLKRKNLEESSWEFSKRPRKSLDSTTDLAISTTAFTVVPLRR